MEKLILHTIYNAFHNTNKDYSKEDIINLIRKKNKNLSKEKISQELDNITCNRIAIYPGKKLLRELTLEEVYFSILNEAAYIKRVEAEKLEKVVLKETIDREKIKVINSQLQESFKNSLR